MRKIIPFLIGMTLLSCFAGMSINRNWFFAYQFELFDFPEIIFANRIHISDITLWMVLVSSHLSWAIAWPAVCIFLDYDLPL